MSERKKMPPAPAAPVRVPPAGPRTLSEPPRTVQPVQPPRVPPAPPRKK